MTQLDVVYKYGAAPNEQAILALSKVRDIYGVRALAFDEAARTVRVEYDATRLTEPTIHQFLRRAGLDLVEKLTMSRAPEPPVEAAPAS